MCFFGWHPGFPSVAVERLRSSSSLAVVPEDGPQLKAHGTQRKLCFLRSFEREAYQELILHKISSSILLFSQSYSIFVAQHIFFQSEFLSSSQDFQKGPQKVWLHFGNYPPNYNMAGNVKSTICNGNILVASSKCFKISRQSCSPP